MSCKDGDGSRSEVKSCSVQQFMPSLEGAIESFLEAVNCLQMNDGCADVLPSEHRFESPLPNSLPFRPSCASSCTCLVSRNDFEAQHDITRATSSTEAAIIGTLPGLISVHLPNFTLLLPLCDLSLLLLLSLLVWHWHWHLLLRSLAFSFSLPFPSS